MLRPHSAKPTHELEELALGASSVAECDLLEYELTFRKRAAARRVEQIVRRRSKELQARTERGSISPSIGHESEGPRNVVPTDRPEAPITPRAAAPRQQHRIDPVSPPVGLRPIEADPEQLSVATAPTDALQIVDAPPGTGKTFTACRRIVWLVEQGVHAHQIWMISFTRAAIAELRIRIRQLSKDGHAVDGLVASTLDSRAWHLVNGFTTRGGEALAGGHEQNIDEAISLLEDPPEALAEWLGSIRHLVVDEAQDLVGSRARLLHAILAALPAGCGVTIFGDRAQAIYGFAEDSHGDAADPFMRQCAARYDGRIVARSLTRVFRTENDGLQRLFDETRSELLEYIDTDGEMAYLWLRDLLLQGFPADDFADPDRYDLQLHRRRYAALDEAMWAISTGESVRLRLSGFPRAITPWVAMVFSECEETTLYRSDFARRFTEASAKWPGTCWPDVDEAWSTLRLLAPLPGGALSLHKLRLTLAGGNVPDPLLLPEFGFHGSIYSTIHASKGREAGQVDVELPPNFESGETDWEEEARVLFVAATRASRDLVVKEGKRLYIARASDGRDVRRVNGGMRRVQIEVGREGDLDLPTVIIGSRGDVKHSQLLFAESHARVTRLRARLPGQGEADPRRYRLFEEERHDAPIDARHLGRLSSSFFWMLKETGTKFWPDKHNFPPSYIQHLHSLGARTVVFTPDDPRYIDAAEPYASTGFFLAPMLVGLPTIPFFN